MNYLLYLNKVKSYTRFFNWYQNLTIILFLYPLFHQRAQILLIGAWVFGSLYYCFLHKTYREFNIKKGKTLAFLSAIYIMYIMEFILIPSKNIIASYLETGALLFVFPLLIILNFKTISKTFLNAILVSYTTSISLLNIKILVIILNQGFFELLNKDSFYHPLFRTIFSSEADIHLPYLGLMYQFAVLIIIYGVIKKRKNLKLSVLILLTLNVFLLILSSFLFSARMSIIASFCAATYMLFNIEKNKKFRFRFILTSLILAVSLSFLSPIKRRIIEVFETSWKIPDSSFNGNHSKVNFRYVIYKCSADILKENFMFGVGLSNVQKKLNEHYKDIEYVGFDDFNVKKYNSHNQYIDFFMAYGILGLFGFVFFILRGWSSKDVLYQSFIIMMLLCFLTENILYRQAGVVFYVLFNTVFYLKGLYKT
jgi:O-antigen ligase